MILPPEQRSLRSLTSQFATQLRGEGVGAELARGASAALAIRIAGTGVALGVQVLLARIMGVYEYGIYVYALSWLSVMALIAALGLDAASLRFIAQYRANEDWGLLTGFLQRSRMAVWAGATGLAVLSAILVFTLRGRLGPGQALTLWLACLLLPLFAQLQLRSAALRALKKIAKAQLPGELLRPLAVAALVLGFLVLAERAPTAPVAMASNLAATFSALGMVTFFLRRELPKPVGSVPAQGSSREWVRVSVVLLALFGFYTLLSQTDILMIGALRSTTQAGIYSAASRLAGLIHFGVIAVNSIAAPMISELYSTHRIRALQRLLRIAALAILAFSLGAVAFTAAAGSFLLGLFGSEFRVAYVPLVILILGQLAIAFGGTVGALMTMTGHQGKAAKIIGFGAVLNIVLNAALIPKFGTVGAACATALSSAVWNLLMIYTAVTRLRLNPTVLRQQSLPR